ncbi:MAG: aconitate hydratase AcnA [Gammaproteobacteria bacterium]
MSNPFEQCKKTFAAGGGEKSFYSLPELQKMTGVNIARLPVCLRVILESLLRNCDGEKITEAHVRALANWRADGARDSEVPFVVARVVLQDFTGVPLLADLAAMRDEAARRGKSAKQIEPLVPVDLVVDHSIQVDHYGSAEAMRLNMEIEFARNRERYAFLKWGTGAFQTFKVVPPGAGIVHQINLEHLARVVAETDGVCHPDTLVGTDSHTTMINGVGVVGWGVGGIEAEAAMLGQPVYMLEPDVVGVHLTGALRPGVTATDMVLTITEMLRNAGVVGKFVEFFGEGARTLSVPDRATIGNMAPEYGATMGFFPADEKTIVYLRSTGRDESLLQTVEAYYRAQNMFGISGEGECDYSRILTADLSAVEPSVAGPRRPQDRIPLRLLKQKFTELFSAPAESGGYGKKPEALSARHPSGKADEDIGDGDILIAAITSCTNTSNPGVLLAAGLLAQKAAARGLRPPARVKTSLAPGSRVVTDYLQKSGLLRSLEEIGFHQVGYGCTTCIGNSGPLDAEYEKAIAENDLVGVAVLSGNRNFEARVHQNIRANFLMSPPLVVAFALAGRIDVDMQNEPLGEDKNGAPVYLKEIWPSGDEIAAMMRHAVDPQNFNARYAAGFERELPLWSDISGGEGAQYEWRDDSTYIRMPPFLAREDARPPIVGARALAILGDSVTTDHISPAGAIKPSSPAGGYLRENGVKVADYNSYGSRRGNHEVMMRGTFANVRIRNLMTPGVEGGITMHQPDGGQMAIFDAAMRYAQTQTPLVIFAGREYGTGSSRDWAAKGSRLLGVRAVVAQSYERIHRSNLAGMGVLPCQFMEGDSAESLRLRGDETFDILDADGEITPRQRARLRIHRADGATDIVDLLVRVDTPTECEYFAKGGILPFVLDQITA